MKQMLVMLFVVLIAPVGEAATFTYTSGALDTATNFNHSTCALGSCADFNNTMHATGSITTTPLPASQTSLDPSPYLTSFTFFDGVTTYSSADPNVRARWTVDTDAFGNIASIYGNFQRWQAGSAPHGASDRFDNLTIFGPAHYYHNYDCNSVGTSAAPQNVPDFCVGVTFDSNSSYGEYATANWMGGAGPGAAAATSVPTLSEWGLMILSTLMAVLAVGLMRRRTR